MNKQPGPVCLLLPCLLLFPMTAASAQETLFFSGFEYGEEPYGLLEAVDLNGARGQIGHWSGDDFPEADARGHFAGGVFGGDSAGFADDPSGGRLLLIDRPLDDAIHFMELSRQVANPGTTFSLTTGLARNGAGGAADFDFFGMDGEGNESFHIRVGADAGTERLGYVRAGEVVFDLPTTTGVDDVGDLPTLGLPPLSEVTATISVHLLDEGYTLRYRNRQNSNQFATDLLPYNGTAATLDRVGMLYRGSDTNDEGRSSFFVDDVRVVTGDPVPPQGPFTAYLNASQKIVLEGSGQSVLGLELRSAQGLLIPPGAQESAPFEFFLANDPHRITFGSLGAGVKVDGELITSAGYSGNDPENELEAFWGDESANLFKFIVSNPQLVSGVVNAEGRIVIAGTGQDVLGLEFLSPAGLLVPASDSAPFEFFLANTSERVTLGNLGNELLLDGEMTLQTGYRGADPRRELQAAWGDATGVSHPFLVRLQALPLDCNGDGLVDEQDLDCICGQGRVSPLLQQLGLLAGDLDADQQVGFPDFLLLSDNFSKPVEHYTDGDLDCNGVVEFADFLLLSDNFGLTSGAAATVPEPSNGGLFLLLGWAVVARRRH